MDLTTIITPELARLRGAFVAAGFDLRLVGGVVRDLLRDIDPKDIDLCTDANPDEQIAIYKAGGFSYHETGLQHGTLTVVLDHEPYEITSLRTESDHDGRHAVVDYTRDWLADLGRRDLTFNAMSLTFDGELFDPFGGVKDLHNGIVRFVGNPDDRMQEDYLRILRWLRFHGRIAPNSPLDKATVEAAMRNAKGLIGISRERVWMEMSKIVVGRAAPALVDSMYDMELAGPMGLPAGHVERMLDIQGVTANPVTVMAALVMVDDPGIDAHTVSKLATDWKWSAAERDLIVFLAKNFDVNGSDYMWLLAHDGYPREWVVELARLGGSKVVGDGLMTMDIPVFPVAGQDLIDAGMAPGKEMGVALKNMKVRWATSRYTLTKDDLLANG
jgi:tRNA nucleotidyltransferase (CCA-adding enzyme)